MHRSIHINMYMCINGRLCFLPYSYQRVAISAENTCLHTYTYIHTCLYSWRLSERNWCKTNTSYAWEDISAHEYAYTHIYVCVCVYAPLYIRLALSLHVYIYPSLSLPLRISHHVHIYIYIQLPVGVPHCLNVKACLKSATVPNANIAKYGAGVLCLGKWFRVVGEPIRMSAHLTLL